MISIGLLIGIYGYSLFFLGITDHLIFSYILILTLLFISIGAFLLWRNVKITPFVFQNIHEKIMMILICLLLLINFIGVLGPEISFDSLWYHLTLPKLYIEEQGIHFIPGNLLYYSAMPKLTELLYISALLFGNEIFAKCIHAVFGIFCLYATYRVARLFLDRVLSLAVVGILLTNLLFNWEMITAYNDLTWAFYEVLAFFCYQIFYISKRLAYLVLTGVFIGFSIMTKPVACISIPIYLILLYRYYSSQMKSIIKTSIIFLLCAFIIPLPWFLFSFFNTGNPLYPFFSGFLSSYNQNFLSYLIQLPESLANVYFFPADPISPLYVIFLPFVFFFLKYLRDNEKNVFMYILFACILTLLIPESGGTRFVLPYLPIFSVGVGIVINKVKKTKYQYLFNLSFFLLYFLLITTIFYRTLANIKYIPYLMHRETKKEFLTKHLEFSFADFYDTDDFFKDTITTHDRVLLLGFHNLYYVNFPFIHESLYTNEKITYIATQKTDLPEKYSDWKRIYTNPKTFVNVYTRPTDLNE